MHFVSYPQSCSDTVLQIIRSRWFLYLQTINLRGLCTPVSVSVQGAWTPMSFVPLIQGSGLTAWTLLSNSRQTQQEALERTPQFSRDVQAFKDKIEAVQTVDDLMNDRALLRVALGAFGLEEDLNNRAFIRRVLESDLNDPTSLANKLSDQRYSSLARTFGFGSDNGPVVLTDGPTPRNLASPDDLLSNPTALRTALSRFGLERDVGNIFFLQKVLESDLSDPDSFVNRLTDTRYAEFRQAYQFGPENVSDNRATNFYLAFKDEVINLREPDDILENPKLLNAAVSLFDLPSAEPTRLRLLLESDTSDPGSFANQIADKRYQAFADAFRFAWPDMNQITDPEVLIKNNALRANALDVFELSDPGDDDLRAALTSDLNDPTSFVNQPDRLFMREFVEAFQNNTWPDKQTKAERFVSAIGDKLDQLEQASDLTFSLDLYEATVDLFGLSDQKNERTFIQKILEADPAVQGSILSLYPDQRYTALTKAFDFAGPQAARTYPEGFADSIIGRYSDRQFEFAVGQSDPNLRLALALERELTTVVNAQSSNDGRWFSIMGSPPLRQVFETVFQLPSSFGTLDLDRQLNDFKARAEATFGTNEIKEFLQPARLEEVQRRFLALSQITQGQSSLLSGNVALQLLAQR